ncbi:uncharacterized protein JCM15063_002692 [Sporobolomyces koalae]|uniref:uncharacterized protein n=1 Tax=Sporobolomyces koalae TaxID=500713 RepID=UPI00317F30F2
MKQQFDRSGRSTGIAWIGYTTEQHAQQAKEAFDGALAKGQNIRVEYDFRPDRPAPGSLLARLEPGPRGPRNGSGPGSVGSSNRREGRPHVGRPERGVSGSSEGRSTRNPGSGRERGAGAAARREPKTNDDLDKELEAFMKSPETTNKPAAVPTAPAPAPAAPAAVESNGDVEMS